ncbi:MAG: DHH family phosphoesterase, partial [Bilophila sp.]
MDWGERLGVPQLIVELLWQRGLCSLTDIDRFLSPGLRHLASPDDWPGMNAAVAVLESGILAGKSVLIWGDYDVDGITGATLALQVLTFHAVPVYVHLPDRRTEGYGLNIPELERLATERAPGLLLTVDCGISDVAAVARAQELGFSVVISDHHLPPDPLPSAEAITNPRLNDTNPCPHLAGVGVAFFLMAALNTRLSAHSGKRMDMRHTLDLVALGTLADMVSLTGQNRILAKNGLLKIAEAGRPGLAELKAASGFSPVAALGAGQVVFSLAPRINAAGRLGSPALAHDMLRTASHDEAATLAHTLDTMNSERRSEEDRIFTAALAQAEASSQRLGLVLYGEDWHQGVIGIVASRIVEAYYRPVLILCADGATLKGSGRSVSEFDLHAGLAQCA